MKQYFQFSILAVALCFGCTPGITKDEVSKNDKIDTKTRAELTTLNKKVYSYLCDNNYEPLAQLFSDSLMARISPDFSKKFMPQIQHVIKGRPYRSVDEFYVKRIKETDTVLLPGGSGLTAYTLKFPSSAHESYVALLVAGDTTNEIMLTLAYSNINGKWKLSNVKGEDYSLNNRNAVEQVAYVRSLEQKGDLMDAINVMSLATHCLNPGGNTFVYASDAAIKKYSDSLINIIKARYPLPYMVNELASKPAVFNIHMEIFNNHFVPMIMYRSATQVTDTIALKKENDAMQRSIGDIFYGMDKNNRAILYRAYNEEPDGKNSPRYYGYVQKLD